MENEIETKIRDYVEKDKSLYGLSESEREEVIKYNALSISPYIINGIVLVSGFLAL